MTGHEAIEKMWEEQSDAAFPADCAGVEISGVNLIKLDAKTAGCVAYYLRSKKALPEEKRSLLVECIESLERVLPDLKGPGKDYFERLWRLGCLVRQQGAGGAR